MNAAPPNLDGNQAYRIQAQNLMQKMGMTFSPENRRFVISAQIYLMLAGLGLVADGSLLSDNASRPAFLHLFTLGFMLFMFYGLGAHMLPRFTGNPLPETRLPLLQAMSAHTGVVAYAVGYFAGWTMLTLCGAILSWTALLIFTMRIWPVLWTD